MYVYVCMYVCRYVRTYVRTYVYAYVIMCICIGRCICILCVYMYIYICTPMSLHRHISAHGQGSVSAEQKAINVSFCARALWCLMNLKEGPSSKGGLGQKASA